MPKMSSQLESVLHVLVGLPLWQTHRAADLQGFSFGAKVERVTARGQRVEAGEFALHVQCAFRIRAGDEILMASRDRYRIVDGGDTWDRRGANLLDVRMAAFIADRCPTSVSAVRAAEVGDLTIEFGSNLALDIWIDDSHDNEHWRLFRPGDETSHIVFDGKILRRG